MDETPLTDIEVAEHGIYKIADSDEWVKADFARSLERRLRLAESALETEKRDAERYRFARDNDLIWDYGLCARGCCQEWTPLYDAEIDALRDKKKS